MKNVLVWSTLETWNFRLAPLLALVWLLASGPLVQADQTNLFGLIGSGQFGASVTVLPNGNFVVTDPTYSTPGVTNAGAVYLYNGATLNVISMLTGDQANDKIGLVGSGMMGGSFGGVTVLANGNYLVSSVQWRGNRGSLTWCSATAGVTGVVSAANSLIGSTANDQVGIFVNTLSNGNYVVSTPTWDNGAVVDVGAVTWCNGTGGTVGAVSAANSLVGSTASDQVGGAPGMEASVNGVVVLSNGNYVVSSPMWDGAVVDAGAVTWCSGTAGVTGTISAANSLVGSTANDQVGSMYGSISMTALANGNYVVRSPNWNNGTATTAGAVTLGNGTGGTVGAISAANSLVGSTSSDQVGNVLTALANGNYVVRSPNWNNGAATTAGAATWCSGTAGVTGTISAANSLVGSTANDQVGEFVTALSNGNYVVSSRFWNGSRGAATWCSGTAGVTGTISDANSLVGSTANDRGGEFVTALANGNYVVSSPLWNNGAVSRVGAATWCSGTAGVTGTISAANSLIGSTASDQVGSGVTALANGNYVVGSCFWKNGAVANAGAATWCSGTAGVTGTISAANSLVGSTSSDQVGNVLTALANGNYVVRCHNWNNGAATIAGAATWCSGTAGVTGTISAANSLVGSTAYDQVGSGLTALANGNYVVSSSLWKNGAVAYAGAATWCNGTGGTVGAVSAANSLVGSTANDMVGNTPVMELTNGDYVMRNANWDNGAVANAGAVTWGNGTSATTGALTSANSVIGDVASGGDSMVFAFNTVKNYLAVGYPAGNRVTLMGYVATSNTITATTGLHGVVAPSGMVTVAMGCSTSFVVTADAYYHIASLLTNGANVNAATNLAVYTSVWANVTADGTLVASFAPDLTTNTGTPHWWLAQYGLTNFEADATNDVDGDGLPTWREYQVGTCPTNAYTAGNPFNDGVLVAAGADPLRNNSQNFAAILNHPELFGLYTSNTIMDLSLGYIMGNIVSNQLQLRVNLQVSYTLETNSWTNAGNAIEWSCPVNTNKAFFRFRATPH